MNSLKEVEIFAGIGLLGASLVTPILVKWNFLAEFLMFSLVSRVENLFLLSALSIYALCNIAWTWRREHRVVVTSAGLAFYVVALEGFVVIGLASLALLWVIPLCLYQFRHDKFSAAPGASREDKSAQTQ